MARRLSWSHQLKPSCDLYSDQKARCIHFRQSMAEVHSSCFVFHHVEDSVPPIIQCPSGDCHAENVHVDVPEPVVKLGIAEASLGGSHNGTRRQELARNQNRNCISEPCCIEQVNERARMHFSMADSAKATGNVLSEFCFRFPIILVRRAEGVS